MREREGNGRALKQREEKWAFRKVGVNVTGAVLCGKF